MKNTVSYTVPRSSQVRNLHAMERACANIRMPCMEGSEIHEYAADIYDPGPASTIAFGYAFADWVPGHKKMILLD